MFVLFAVSNIMGVTDIKDEKFITRNKNYLTLTLDEINVKDYLKYEKLDFIDYIIPRRFTNTIKYKIWWLLSNTRSIW